MQKDLRSIQVLRASREKSPYVGTQTEYEPYNVIKGQVSPVTDNYSISTYGERVSRMHNVLVEFGEDVRNGDKLIVNGEECTVVSVLIYSSHIVATVERTGSYDGSYR